MGGCEAVVDRAGGGGGEGDLRGVGAGGSGAEMGFGRRDVRCGD